MSVFHTFAGGTQAAKTHITAPEMIKTGYDNWEKSNAMKDQCDADRLVSATPMPKALYSRQYDRYR